ncbi:MAG: VCBS repeat-containing protein [Planctomycetes bacterium]|nr:VCBS repeat-containing protein [Planctomycetota bacterium]
MPVRFRKECIAATQFEAVAVCDVDGDGILDLVCGDQWYQGPDFRKWHPVSDLARYDEYYDDFSGISLDVNGNGSPDIVSGGWWGESLRWRENPGKTGEKWKEHIVASDIGSIETTRAWDIDGNGTIDIVPNTPGRELCAYRLTAPNTFSKHVIYPEACGHGLGYGDIDGDGYGEIITPKGILKRPADGPWSGPWTLLPGPDLGDDASIPILIVDLDGDGEAEVISGHSHSYGLDWYKRNGDEWIKHSIDPDNSQYHDLIWADIDGDGSPELITGKRYRAHCGNDPGAFDDISLSYFKWTGDGFAKHVISQGPVGVGKGCGIHFQVADLRNSGRLDIIAPGKDGLAVFWNEGN